MQFHLQPQLQLPMLSLTPQQQADEEPPLSRLFVTGPTTLTQDVLQQAFAVYGNVQHVQLLMKPGLGFTGRCFVKYDRASSAALAMENLNGATVEGVANLKPLSVVFAVPRGQTKESMLDTEIPPKSRLFVTYHRGVSDEEFKGKFTPYVDVEEFKILKTPTGEPRGIGYVKFSKTSSALRAMEDINDMETTTPTTGQPYRVKISGPNQPRATTHTSGVGAVRPRPGFPGLGLGLGVAQGYGVPQRLPMVPAMQGYGDFGMQQFGDSAGRDQLPMWKNPALGAQRIDNNTPPGSRVWLTVSKRVPIEHLANIFQPFGFLESIYLMRGRNCGFAKYSNSNFALSACNSLNGLEIAPETVLKVAMATPQVEGITDPQVKRRRV